MWEKQRNARQESRACLGYLAVSILCLMLGAVYESMSYGVSSPFMVYAFVPTLVGGALPCSVRALSRRRGQASSIARRLYRFGLAALTVGCFVQGALDIYGTTSPLIAAYWIAGGLLSGAGIALQAIEGARRRREALVQP